MFHGELLIFIDAVKTASPSYPSTFSFESVYNEGSKLFSEESYE